MIEKREVIDYLREYESFRVGGIRRELEVPLNSDFIVSVIGPRRAGKSYYFLMLREKMKDTIYLNFEDTRLYYANYKDIREIIRIFVELYGKNPRYIMLDEIQNVSGWESAVRELYDLKKGRIFITGSSSKLLSSEIATQLRGRSLTYFLLPFSFREFLRFRGVKYENLTLDDEAMIKNLLKEYMEYGGFPDVVKNEDKVRILREYSDLILFRDFVERHGIRNINLARAIHEFVIQNFSREVSIKRIYDRIRAMKVRVSKDTVYHYISHLEDTMFFFFLRRFTEKIHLRESWPKKIYLADTGISKVVRYTEDTGRLMENIVFLKLLREKNDNPTMEIFYFRNTQGEVDFVVQDRGKTRELIQVTYASGVDEVERREIKSLTKIADFLRCKNLKIITWDYEDTIHSDNYEISLIPMWKYLVSI